MSVNRYQVEQSYIEIRVWPETVEELKSAIRDIEIEQAKWGLPEPLTLEVDDGGIVFRFPTTRSSTGGWPGD